MAQSDPFRLSAGNFGIQLVWGAILAVSLQSRCIELLHGNAVASYALIAASGAGIAAIVQVIAGHLSDRRALQRGHRHEFYLAGALTSVPLLWWFFSASTFPQLLLAFFGLQISMNVLNASYQAAIPDYVPEPQQTITASWMSVLQSLGAAAGLVVAGFVQSEQLVAIILAAGLLLSFSWSYRHIRKLDATPCVPKRYSYSAMLMNLLISRGLINIGFYTVMGFLIFYVRESLHVIATHQRMDAALLFLTFTLMGVIGALLAARRAAEYDKRTVISIANGVMIVALLILSMMQSLAGAFAATAIAGISWGAFTAVDWALACTILPRRSIATAMGIWNLASVVPQVIAPVYAAPLIMYGNSIFFGFGARLAMMSAAAAFLFGTLAIWRIPSLVNTASQKGMIL